MPQSWLFSWLRSRPDTLGTMGPASWPSWWGSAPTPSSGSLFTITVLKSFSELASEAWSPRVKQSCQPQVHGLVPKQRSRWGGSSETRGEISQTRRENAQLRPGSVRAGIGSFLDESLEAGARQPNPNERRLRGGRAPAPRAHPARPRPGGRPAGGREGAPGPRSPSCLPAATAARGAGGDSSDVPGEAERSGLTRGLGARS